MTGLDYDLIVIGGGSGGVRCSRMAARQGAKVLCIEKRFWGGTCVNVGCVPKKLYVLGSEFSEHCHTAESFGWAPYQGGLDWHKLKAAKDAEISRLNGIYEQLLKNNDVDRRWGHATLIDGNTVQVEDQVFRARYIVLATGSRAVLPEFPGAEHVLTSDDFFEMDASPSRAVVMGGGYIAVELAGILNGAGIETHLVYRGDCLLRGFDNDVRATVQKALQLRGVHVHLNKTVNSVQAGNGCYKLLLEEGGVLETERIFAAVGRSPYARNLGLETCGIETNASGAVVVDEHYRTSVPSVFAVGDLINRKQLTPVALAEGMYVANYLFGGNPRPLNYEIVATAVFSQPSIGTVGLSEAQCYQRGKPFKVFKNQFKPMSSAFMATEERIFLKMLVDESTDKILGMHMVGANAGEIIQGFAAAMTCGATKQQLDDTIGIHPTVAEEFVTMREVASTVTPGL